MPLQPKDYILNVPDPNEGLRQNLQFGLGLAQVQQNRDELALKQQQEQQKQATAVSLQEELAQLAANPSPQAVVQTMLRRPELAEKLKPGLDALDANERKARVAPLSQAYAAILNGAPDVALGVLKTQETAYRNSGRAQDADGIGALVKQIQTNPGAGAVPVAATLALEMGLDKFTESFGKFAKLPDEMRQGTAAANKAVSDAMRSGVQAAFEERQQRADLDTKAASADSSRASAEASRDAVADRAAQRDLNERKFALEEKKFEAEKNKALVEAKKVSPQIFKEVATEYKAAEAARKTATEADSVADAYAKHVTGFGASGLGADIAEYWKRVRGTQNDVTKARIGYEKIVGAFIKESRPPGSGVMTDQDYAVARQAYPPANGNPALIVSTLREIAQKRRDDAKANLIKAAAVRSGVYGMTPEQLDAREAELLAKENE